MRKLLRTIISAIISLTVSIPVSAMNRSNGTYTALSSFQYSYKMAATGCQPYITTIDPSCEKYYRLSPYLYCANNPIMLIDKDGCDPIYDTRGNFLGVDDKGLQGNPIIMDKNNFQNGMSHDVVAGYACNPMDDRIWERIKRHHSSLRYRPDYDGVVTMTEGIAWAKAHPNALKNPTPDNMLYIDVSKLDFGPLSVSDFKKMKQLQCLLRH